MLAGNVEIKGRLSDGRTLHAELGGGTDIPGLLDGADWRSIAELMSTMFPHEPELGLRPEGERYLKEEG